MRLTSKKTFEKNLFGEKEEKDKMIHCSFRQAGIITIIFATLVVAAFVIFAGLPMWWLLVPLFSPVLAILALILLGTVACIIEAILAALFLILLSPIVLVLAICFDVE